VILFQLVIGDFRRPLIEGWQQRVDDPLLRGDIIAAVQDAPARRLGTATDLAERIRTLEERRQKRDLAELRAIEAEALRKRVERQKLLRPWQLSAALALSVGVVFSLFSAYNASVARAEAEREAETAVAVTEFLTNDVFGAIDPFVGQQVSAALKTLLSAGAERIESSLSSQPAVKAPLHRQIGLLYLRVGDYGLAKEQFQKAEALAGSEEDRIFALAGTLTAAAHSGQREEAAKLAAEIKDLLAANQKERSNVWTTVALASEAYFGGRIAEGEQIYRDYFATATLPDSRWPAELVVAKLNWIGMIFQMRQIDEALSQLLTLQAAVERGQIDNPVSLITIDYLTGRAQLARGEFDEAYLSLSRAEEKSLLSLDEGHPTRQGIYNDLGQVLADLGKYEEALGRLRRALDERLARYSPDHILPMHSRYAITLTELRSGSIERSLSEARATTAAASSLPVNHPLRQGAELLLAEVLLAAGRADEMEALLDKLPEAEISNGVPTLVLQARHKYLRSRLEHAKDDLESAVALAQESLSLAKAVLGSRHYWSVTIGQWANDLGVGDLD
jgi:eukaryotic-like serine/threonine-protein kinase